ncbi:MAG: TetR/AcrR family transcriptional regulator [Myxococcales bacterium]|nr:TetR/AcrR family transcriptional regulator [Myxococcales bacterium]
MPSVRQNRRRTPIQTRSTQLVRDVLEAAVRVLEWEGVERFTTTRVAEVAGVSVGSVYQYFADKHAILFQLQLEEWDRTGALMEELLSERALPADERLRRATRAFFRSEREEAPLRRALQAVSTAWEHGPEAHAVRERAEALALRFVAELAPHHRDPAFAARMLLLTLRSMGLAVSEEPDMDVDRAADAVTVGLIASLRH